MIFKLKRTTFGCQNSTNLQRWRAEVFREASLSQPARALQLELEDEILTKITQDETKIMDWLKKRITNANDWPYQCVIKGVDGREKNTLFIRFREFNSIQQINAMTHEEVLTNEPWSFPWKQNISLIKTYVRAPTGVQVKGTYDRDNLGRGDKCTGPGMDNVIFVSYCPNPASCGVDKKVFVSWKKFAICFFRQGAPPEGHFGNCYGNRPGEKCIYVPKNMLDTADRF